MSNWFDDPFFTSSTDNSQITNLVGGDQSSSIIHSVVSICQNSDVELTRRKIVNPQTGKSCFSEIRKLGNRQIQSQKTTDRSGSKTVQHFKNVGEKDLASFNSDWNRVSRTLPKPENLNIGSSPGPTSSAPPVSPKASPKLEIKAGSPVNIPTKPPQLSPAKPPQQIQAKPPPKVEIKAEAPKSSNSRPPSGVAANPRAVPGRSIGSSSPNPSGSSNNGKFATQRISPNAGQVNAITLGPGCKIASHDDELRGLALVNVERKKFGLSPLVWDQQLSDLALPHSIRMMQKVVPISHEGASERFAAAQPHERAGENVGFNFGHDDPVGVMDDSWIKSPHHHENMIGPFTHFGVAYAISAGGEWYGTQIYARRAMPGQYKISKVDHTPVLQAINKKRRKPFQINNELGTQLDKLVTDIAQRFKKPSMDGFDVRADHAMKKMGKSKYTESVCCVDTNNNEKKKNLDILIERVLATSAKNVSNEEYTEVGICIYRDNFDFYSYALAFAR